MEAEREFMLKAIEAAKMSGKSGNYAIGAVVVKGNEVISVGYATLKTDNDPVNGHAEIDAIRKACKKLNQPYLEGCVLYSTHEPCPMCASASVWAKIECIVFGVTMEDMFKEMEKANPKLSWRQIDISCNYILERGVPKIKLIPGFMREECIKLFDLTK